MPSGAPRILVWGAGAIGGSVGAWLARAGHEITIVDTNAAHVDAINADGLRIVGPVDRFTVRLNACTPETLAGRWPVVLLAVKAQATEAACKRIANHLDGDGCVVSLQNGLCESVIARELGARRTVGALVGFAGDWLSPGEIRFGQRAKFAIGELDGRMSPRLGQLAAILADFEPEVEVTTDIMGYLWGKLGFTALIFGTALGNATISEQFASPDLLPAWRALAGEVVAVALAGGTVPRGFDGFDPEAFAPGADEASARASMITMARLLEGGGKPHSGPWRDIAIHRRKTEIADQIGPVVESGLQYGVATPVLRRLVELVQSLECAERSQSDQLTGELAHFASETYQAHAA